MSKFHPGWLPSVCVALLLPLLLALGGWQLQRAEEKRQLLSLQQQRWQAEPLPLQALAGAADSRYRRVLLQGYFDAQHTLLLDNRTRNGRAGVEILQPFFDQPSGLWVLLNRGWLAWPDRRTPPTVSTPEGSMRLVASVYQGLGDGFLSTPPEPATQWPQLVAAVDGAGFWQHLGRQGFALELRVEPGPASLTTDWAVVAMPAQKHMGYAVQWFALAAALLGLYLYLGLHTARELHHESSRHHA